MTKAQVMALVSWMIDHADEISNMSNGRIAQVYEEDTGIAVSSYVIKNNKNKWIKHNGQLYKRSMPWLYEDSPSGDAGTTGATGSSTPSIPCASADK